MSRAEAEREQLFVLTAPPITTSDELEAAYQAACVGRTLEQIRPVLALRNLALDALLQSPPAQELPVAAASAAPLPEEVLAAIDAVDAAWHQPGWGRSDVERIARLAMREAVPEGCVVVRKEFVTERMLRAPCVYCGYAGAGYWQAGTHWNDCPWKTVAGEEARLAAAKEKTHG